MEESPHFDEKRRHPRRLFTAPIEYLTQKGTGRDLCQNISQGGLFLGTGEIKKQLYVGQEILLNIPSKDRVKLVKVMGKVTRVETHGVGVQFKKMMV